MQDNSEVIGRKVRLSDGALFEVLGAIEGVITGIATRHYTVLFDGMKFTRGVRPEEVMAI
jgi:hypothetical protein